MEQQLLIQQSKDYKQFDTILGNRNIKPTKVKNIIHDIKAGINLLPYCPIIVYRGPDDRLKVVDGQHRLEVCKSLKEPVYYVECEQLDLKKIARLNSRSDKWKNADFLNCYVELGIQDYMDLKDFIDEYKIVCSAAISLLMHGTIKTKGLEAFRNGEFKCNYLDEMSELAELTADVFERYVFYNDRYLIEAVRLLKEAGKCDFEHLKEKIRQTPMSMSKQDSPKSFMYNIERVYNHSNSKRISIF